MQRCNFTLDDSTLALLSSLSEKYYNSNKSLTIRAALESLAAHVGHEGWIVTGYTPVMLEEQMSCHTCHEPHGKGDVLYRPVFERGTGVNALPKLPVQVWLDCPTCVEKH
jgi:hypothetical protein